MYHKKLQTFIQNLIAPNIQHVNSNPKHYLKELGKEGLIGINVPIDFGGRELGIQSHTLFIQDLHFDSEPLGQAYFEHSHLCMDTLIESQSENLLDEYSEKMCSGEIIAGYLVQALGDQVEQQASLVQEKDYFIVNGKYLFYSLQDADIYFMYICDSTLNQQEQQENLTGFIIEKHFQGVKNAFYKAQKDQDPFLEFKDLKIPRSHVIGDVNCFGTIARDVFFLTSHYTNAQIVGVM